MSMVGHRGDGVVPDDRGDDSSVGIGVEGHQFGGEGAQHRALNDSAHEAETSRSAVGITSRHRQERGRVQRKKIHTDLSRFWPTIMSERCRRKEIS